MSPGNVSKIWAFEELAKNGLEDASIEEIELKAKESENFRFCRKCKIAKVINILCQKFLLLNLLP